MLNGTDVNNNINLFFFDNARAILNFSFDSLFFLVPVVLLLIIKGPSIFNKIKTSPKYYTITKIKEYKDDVNLHDYEKAFLGSLFKKGDIFNTLDMTKDTYAARDM